MRSWTDRYHWFYPLLGALRYRFPSRRLRVIAVTGTDGKSSTVVMLARIMNAAGYRTGHFSSVSYGDGVETRTNNRKMTTPGRFFLQKFLRQLADKGCQYAVLEITSEGIKQYRHALIGFEMVVFTNITPEHIERHGGFERYRDTKLSLLKRLKKGNNPFSKAIINTDDPVLTAFVQESPRIPIVRVSFTDETADVYGVVESNDIRQTACLIQIGRQHRKVRLGMGGPFAAHNALLAIAAATALQISLEVAVKALTDMPAVPGRFEAVHDQPLVIVDYGHTIAAWEALLPYVRAQTKGKLIHVFGAAGGGRDRWKRTKLAALSEQYADLSILTEENPFDEATDHIIEDIRKGFNDSSKVRIVPVREHAVRAALLEAEPADTILLSAKGSETVIAGPRGARRPYNERAYVAHLFADDLKASGNGSFPAA